MAVGIFNLVVGLAFVVGGLTKKLTLLGTNSWEGLAGLGAVIAGLGAYQIYKARSGR